MSEHLTSTYAHLTDDLSATLQPVTPEFWPALVGHARPDLEEGRLVMVFDCDRDWPTWEMHPAGDEVVVLISGAATFVLRLPTGDQTQDLTRPGERRHLDALRHPGTRDREPRGPAKPRTPSLAQMFQRLTP